MANQITLGATLLFNGGDGTGGAPDDLSGVATGTADTSTYLQGSTSYTYSASNSRSGMLYDNGSVNTAYANSVFYITVNSGVVGLLTDFRVRFCGNTVTDFFEVEVGSSTSWPTSIQGGWVTFIVDIQDAKADAGRVTGGTEPATNAIRYIGFSQILSVMPKMADNTWFDTLYYLPDGTAGIIVEGRNAGSTDWNAADILTQLGTGQMFYYQGAGGSYTLTTSIQFGINDTSTHGFTDTNAVWLFEDQTYVPSDLYKISALGNSGGTTNVTFGAKSGTGDAATGAQGFTISASSAGARWDMDFNDPNIDLVGLYGCSFQHGGAFLLDDPAVSVISSLYIDCTSALVSNSEQLRVGIVDANTADDVAFMTTDDLTDVVFSNFAFSDGHAVELTTPNTSSQTSKGNKFVGYGADTTTDAAVYNNSGAGLVTINVTDSGTGTTYKNGTSATTQVNSSVIVTVSGATEGSAIKLISRETLGAVTAGDTLATGFANSSGVFTYSHNDQGSLDITVVARNQGIATACIADDGGAQTDETEEGSSNATADMTLLPTTPAANDQYFFGHQEEFTRLKLNISTALVQSSAPVITWQYWNGAWVALSGVTDGTNIFQNTGENIVSWTAPGDWATTTVNSQGPLFYIRARLTTLGTITTAPIGKRVTLDTSKYLPYSRDREIVTGDGLSDVVTWTPDTISKFDSND